jgi:transaldolase
MTSLEDLHIKIFADGADLSDLSAAAQDPMIRGFTTNPTLMRQAGVDDFEQFAIKAVELIGDRPISFEVFTDDFGEMRRQAQRISTWGDSVFVKIPVTNCAGQPSYDLVTDLVADGIRVNVTAVFTIEQIESVADRLVGGPPSNISVFAGRIADAGQDPCPYVRHAVHTVADQPQIEVIWASPREVLNVVQADECGCHIITLTADLMKKLPNLGRDLAQYSLETVEMFRLDAVRAGYEL